MTALAARGPPEPTPPSIAPRRALLFAAAALAVTAILAGLGRLGFDLPARGHGSSHGPLLVLGVFVTLISLERAVAAGSTWTYAAPVLASAGGVGSLFAPRIASVVSLAATGVLVAVNLALVRRQTAAFTGIMLLGSVVLFATVGGWAVGLPLHAVAPAWMAFFVLTILAERLELSRLAPTPRWATAVLAALTMTYASLVLAQAVSPVLAQQAGRLMGVMLIGIALWEAAFDLARRTLRRAGLPRFVAVGVLLGTVWLAIAGSIAIRYGWLVAGPGYDAILHAVFVGFVLSMVFAHAPIVLPAVARIQLPFHPVLYGAMALLHLGLATRIGGDLGGSFALRRTGALLSALALPAFFLSALLSRALARRAAGR